MALAQPSAGPTRRSGLGVAYAMTGIALGCIFVSGILGALFTPQMVTGYYHERIPISAMTGWIFDLIAIGMLASTALFGIRAGVADRAPWAMLGFGVGAIWLAVMVVSICAPLSVFGTDPDQIPVFSGLGAIAGVVLTGILCSFVKTAAFEAAGSRPGLSAAGPSRQGAWSADDPAARLQQLARLRDAGAITDAEYRAKKRELLDRI